MRRRLALAATVAALAACAANPGAPPAEYDFGIGGATLEEPPRLRREITVAEATAPAWLDSSVIVYRLAYRDAAQPRAYVESRWVAPPAALFTAQLRQRLVATTRSGVLVPGDGVRTTATLRVELQEFSQVFDSPERSRAVVRVRAVLVSGGQLVAQTSFSVDRPAPSPDAAGGARALALAADAAIDRLIGWTADALK
jgi:cholesterol transport system auxiliary component